MLISHERRFIFIHNFKTGGTSIRRALAGVALEQPSSIWLVQAALHYARPIGRIANRAMTRPPLARAGVMPKHNTAAQAKAILPDFIWRGYFKFGFVRNPWSREYSNFGMFRRSHPDRVPDSFEAYVHDYLPDNFFTQTAFFYDDRGERLVDFVGRFETSTRISRPSRSGSASRWNSHA